MGILLDKKIMGHIALINSGVATLMFYEPDFLAADANGTLYLSGQGRLRKISPTGVISTPDLAWGNPPLPGMAYANGTLFSTIVGAILQLPLP